jgi:hypothetical protein
LGWLAVPPDAIQIGSSGTAVELKASEDGTTKIYGKPTLSDTNVIGNATPYSSVFVSAFTTIEDGTNNLWYEINYNHRQAWVPATEVAITLN